MIKGYIKILLRKTVLKRSNNVPNIPSWVTQRLLGHTQNGIDYGSAQYRKRQICDPTKWVKGTAKQNEQH